MDMFPLQITDAITRRQGKTLVVPITTTSDGSGTTVIIGPNGSGKTTFLKLLHGTTRMNEGTLIWAFDTTTASQKQAFEFQ